MKSFFFFEFLISILKGGQNDGRDHSQIGVEYYETLNESMIKLHIMYLKISFEKFYEQTFKR
jgi:hypothetical protein